MSLLCLVRHVAQSFRLIGLLLAAPFLIGAGDGYLREIEEEVKRQATTLITTAPQSAPPLATTAVDTSAERLASGLEPTAFEQALRRNLPGTYTLYEQLDATAKQQAYEAYQNDNRLANISAQITRLLSGKP
ncbi:MAG: hypothetical protein HC889_15855 [Synechococcaceae cyanobacterium SM1_2_3]|nr:hypothetical protein [Synechococcaceae cyanobacterium SM1_2_3]